MSLGTWGVVGAETPSAASLLRDQVETSGVVAVTASVTANTKGAWTELIASTDDDGTWLYMKPYFGSDSGSNLNGNDTSCLLDIGIGAAGAESVIIPNLAIGYSSAVGLGLLLPVSVPSGSRIAARCQRASPGGTYTDVYVNLSVLSDTLTTPSTIDAIGAVTASTRGVTLSTDDTYVEVTASTSQDYQAIIMGATAAGTSFVNEEYLLTLASGGSGSETPLMMRHYKMNTLEQLFMRADQWFPLYVGDIPAGTRLAVKSDIGRSYRDVILYGVPTA